MIELRHGFGVVKNEELRCSTLVHSRETAASTLLARFSRFNHLKMIELQWLLRNEDRKDEKLKETQHLGCLQQDGSGVLNAFDQPGKPEEVDSS